MKVHIIATPEYEEWYNKMKSDLQKLLEDVRSQRETLQRTEEELRKQLQAEKPEFDFRAKMPAGSVWLGNLTVNRWDGRTITFLRQHDEDMAPTIYHAHQIVKAAQHMKIAIDSGYSNDTSAVIRLDNAVEAAEQDGVLQNLE